MFCAKQVIYKHIFLTTVLILFPFLVYGQTNSETLSQDNSFVSDLFLVTDTTERYEKAKTTVLQMFIYLDSAVCHRCVLQNTVQLSDFSDIEQSADRRFSMNYIVAPKQRGHRVFVDYIRQLELHNIVYYDYGQGFLNTIKKNPDYETGKPWIVLLDDRNNVLLMEALEMSPSMYDKYMYIIKSYIDTL